MNFQLITPLIQGMFGNGLPNPAERTVQGSVDGSDLSGLIGINLTMQLQDGRRIGVTISDESGTIHTRPACTTGCSCC